MPETTHAKAPRTTASSTRAVRSSRSSRVRGSGTAECSRPISGDKRFLPFEGAGDCCDSNTTMSEGTFYQGAIVAGYPTYATDDAVQANIVAAQYGK